MVSSSPLTRSSYHAGDDFQTLRANREAKLAADRRLPTPTPKAPPIDAAARRAPLSAL